MRQAQGRRGNSPRTPPRNLLNLEQLETRLTLSHAPFDGSYAPIFGSITQGPDVARTIDSHRVLAGSEGPTNARSSELRSLDLTTPGGPGIDRGFVAEYENSAGTMQTIIFANPAPLALHAMPVVIVVIERAVDHADQLSPIASPANVPHHDAYDRGDRSASPVNLPSGMPPAAQHLGVPNNSPSEVAPLAVSFGNETPAQPSLQAASLALPPRLLSGPGNSSESMTQTLPGALLSPPDLGRIDRLDAPIPNDDVPNRDSATPVVPADELHGACIPFSLRAGGVTTDREPFLSVTLPVAGTSERAALLACIGIDVQALDRALDAAMSELEQLGGDLASWFDNFSVPSLSTAAGVATVLTVGGAYVWRNRARRSEQEKDEEFSSTWLFTRFQAPAGQS